MRVKRLAGACVAVAAGAMSVCSPAVAGTVGYQSYSDRSGTYATISFTAAAGERNNVAVAMTPTTAVITDARRASAPDPAFTATSDHCTFRDDRVVCRTDGEQFAGVFVSLGDGDDQARVEVTPLLGSAGWPVFGERATIDGGPGNDALIGSEDDDRLIGGSGADDIHGGGGTGDTVVYSEDGDQAQGVTVTLDDVADDGRPGEGDNVHRDVENVLGTDPGANALTGSAADNALWGGEGNDVLRGKAGNDELHGGSVFVFGGGGDNVLDGGIGLDTLIGYEEDDVIYANDGEPDLRISCGGGNDTVYDDQFDAPDPDCETVHTG
jgi:Ca2+-binding RTX toxin-like protein